jgi:tRNA(Ile2) C34 agmatinyltransferase TiaS
VNEREIHIIDLDEPEEEVTVEEAVAEGLEALYAGEVEDDEEDDLTVCPVCAGPVYPLGSLGARQHFRCRNCGLDLSHDPVADEALTQQLAAENDDPSEQPY